MDSTPRKIAIPRFGETVAPCFGFSATVSIFIVSDGEVIGQSDFVLQSQRELDRLRLLRDQEVEALICGGLQDRFEDIIRASGIRVISWVTGNVEELLSAFLRGELHEDSKPTPAPGRVATKPDEQEKGI